MDAPRNPFGNPPRDSIEQPDSPRTDQSSSATGVFGQVPATPRAEEDLLASLLGQAAPEVETAEAEPLKLTVTATPGQPVAPVAAESVKEAAAAAPEREASHTPGEFTRMLQALTVPGASGSAGSKAGPNAGLGAPEMGRANEVGRVFSPVMMEKKPNDAAVGISPAARPVSPALVPPSQAEPAPPGAFTRMFSSMGASASSGSAPAPTLAADKPVASPPSASAPAAAPGEFTRMFSSREAATPTSSAPAQPSPGPPSPPAAPRSGPGEFTRMFSSPVSSGQESMPSSPVSSAAAERTGVPGIQSSPVSESKFGASAAQSEPGAFTKMFAGQGASAPPQEDPLKSLRQTPSIDSRLHLSMPQTPAAPPPAEGGFTQLLQALNQEPKPKEPAPVATSSFAPLRPASQTPDPIPAPPPPAAPVAAGGFTRLLQSLAPPAGPPLASVPFAAPAAAPPMPSAAAPAAPFAATPLAPASPWATPPSLPPSAPPPKAPGPGEFTRVISGSALRDLQGAQGMPPAASAPPAPAPVWMPPQMPKPPAMPPMSATPGMPQGMPGVGAMPGMHAGMPPAGGGGVPFAPQAFGMSPAVSQPPVPAAPPQTTLQKYLPLILVVNVFLLLVIVLILFFVMHHK